MRNQLITKHLTAALMLGGLTMLVAGCSDNYYRVTDPTSGKEYYTTKVGDAGKGGAVKMKDEKTGSPGRTDCSARLAPVPMAHWGSSFPRSVYVGCGEEVYSPSPAESWEYYERQHSN